jgi:hypothetical protein
MMKIINEVRDSATSDKHRKALDDHANLLIEAVENSSPAKSDLDELRRLKEVGQGDFAASRQKFDRLFN